MPLYEPQPATLGGIEGQGYAFQKKTPGGETYQGIFFAEEKDTQHLEQFLLMKEVRFTGVFYRKLMGGSVSKHVRTVLVDVYQRAHMPAGERLDFTVLEEV